MISLVIVRVWIGTSSGRRGIDDEAIIPDVGSILVVIDGEVPLSGGSILVVVRGTVREGSTIVKTPVGDTEAISPAGSDDETLLPVARGCKTDPAKRSVSGASEREASVCDTSVV